MVMTIASLLAVMIVMMNLIADILYGVAIRIAMTDLSCPLPSQEPVEKKIRNQWWERLGWSRSHKARWQVLIFGGHHTLCAIGPMMADVDPGKLDIRNRTGNLGWRQRAD
jgi:hypothetical protein